MNDTERDLRELFETKAREAGSAPRVTPEVLRRGRRRQAGTIAVAGITALAVAAAAIVSLQALNRADTDAVPGGPQGNPSFTTTIQSFSVTVPEGWTLIDQSPLGMNMSVGSSGTFSCVGAPIEAGSGKISSSATATSDCSRQQTQTSERPTIPQGGLPMLTLSNDDPGLGGSVCNAGGSLPATSASLYIALDYDVTRTAGWENMAASPQSLVNVLEDDLPPEQMPCGPGGYSWFKTGGAPYIAWAGFGSEVTDADREALLGAYDGMKVSNGEITSPTTDVQGYVLTGGTTGSGAGWNIEAYPNGTNVEMAYTEEGGRRWGGAGDFGPPVEPILLASGHGVVFGAVTFEAERVELRPADGSAPVPGSILQLPETLGAPFDAFVVPGGADGEVVAVGPDGDLGSAPVGNVPAPEPGLAAWQVQSDLRNAYVAAKTYYTERNTYEGFTPDVAHSIEPSLAYNTAAQAVAGEVSIRDVGADHIVFAEATDAGDVLCIAKNSAGATTYGAVDAQTADECVDGEAAWGIEAPAPGSAGPPRPLESSVDLEGFGAPATLTVGGELANGCVSIEIQIGGDRGMGVAYCVNGPMRPDEPFAAMQPAGSADGVTVVSGYVPPEADRVFLISDDGRRFDAPVLYTIQVEPRVQFFAFPVSAKTGELHVEDVNGVELSAPVALSRAP